MENSKKAERRKQEDAALNRALLWFAAAVLLEFLLLIVNKYYINFTTSEESIALAWAFRTGLKVVSAAGLLGAAACGVWGWRSVKRQGRLPFFSVLLGVTLLAAAGGSMLILRYFSSAVQLLYILVPAGAVVALVFYLYQKEFFVSLCSVGVGMLGLWLVRRSGNHSTRVYLYMTLAAVALLVVMLVLLALKKNAGVFSWKDKQYRILPKRTNYLLMVLSCMISLLAMLAGLLLGATAAYYLLFVLMAWLFVLLVYYTVKMM